MNLIKDVRVTYDGTGDVRLQGRFGYTDLEVVLTYAVVQGMAETAKKIKGEKSVS